MSGPEPETREGGSGDNGSGDLDGQEQVDGLTGGPASGADYDPNQYISVAIGVLGSADTDDDG